MLSVIVLSVGVLLLGWYFNHVTFVADPLDFWETCDYYYNYNNKFNVQDPPVERQEKRFQMQRMMDSIVRVSNAPAHFDEYTIGKEKTGVHETWDADHEVLGDMCTFLMDVARYYLHSATPADKKQRCLDMFGDFVPRFVAKMDGKHNTLTPWKRPDRSNWYQFSISATQMLYYGAIIADTDGKRTVCCEEILRIISSPRCSLRWCRDGANMVYMALPWITAHYFLHEKDIELWAQHPSYRCAVEYIKFPMVTTRKNEGLYLDSTYIAHVFVLAYGYMANMTTMSDPIVAFDDLMRNFILDYRRVQTILFHPTLPYGPIGFFTRDPKTTVPTFASSPLGIRVIPTCLFIRMYGPDYSFACRGQVPWIAFYEADRSNNTMAQYWVQYRGVRFASDPPHKATFPEPGFAYQKFKDAAEQIPVTDRCVIPSQTSTTTPWKPAKSDGQPDNLRFGFVFSYGNIGIMRHFYNCTQMRYTTESTVHKDKTTFGQYSIDEFILCNYDTHTIDIYIRILKKEAFTMILCAGPTKHEWSQWDPSLGVWHMHWDCKSKTLTSEFSSSDTIDTVIEEKYPKGYTVVDSDAKDTVILLDNGQPKMAMYPDDKSELNRNFVTKYQNKEYTFQFDETTNQYWVYGQCVEA